MKNIVEVTDCLTCMFLKPIEVNSDRFYTEGIYYCMLAKELNKEYRIEILFSTLTFLWYKCPCKDGVLFKA